MNKTLSTSLIVVAVLALAVSIFFFGIMYGRTGWHGPSVALVPNGNARPFGWNNNSYSPGMMAGNGGYGMGPGMMRRGYGWIGEAKSNITPLTVNQARQAAEKYLQTLNISGLRTGEVMIFDNNAYVVIKESETGLGAFELLIDPISGNAYPEYGPNMMWNAKYGGLSHAGMMNGNGMMIGMTLAPGTGAGMGGNGWDNGIPATVSSEMSITSGKAIEYAQKYLDLKNPGATAATDPTQFYGFYTIDFEKDGKVIGMLSVNGYNGQVFLHIWHGTFIEEAE